MSSLWLWWILVLSWAEVTHAQNNGAAGSEVAWSPLHQDEAPNGNSFLRMRVANVAQCKTLCQRTSSCHAIIFQSRDRQCLLLPEVGASLQSNPGTIYAFLEASCTSGAACSSCPNGSVSVTVDKDTNKQECITVVTCGLLSPMNGFVSNQTGNLVGDTATFSCNAGYTFVGTSHMTTCSVYGSWTPLQGSCLVECGSPPLTPNGIVTDGGTYLGRNATYTCHGGYMFVGSSSVTTCSVNGSWTELHGDCLKKCGREPFLDRARLTTVYGSYQGSVVTYDCPYGHVLTYTCSSAGTWEHNGMPAFQRVAGLSIAFMTNRLSWQHARRSCQSFCGDLVVLDNAQKFSTVVRLATQRAMGTFWVGASDVAHEGDWRWVNGQVVTGNVWGQGEPSHGGAAEDCATQEPNYSFLMNDDYCGGPKAYACSLN